MTTTRLGAVCAGILMVISGAAQAAPISGQGTWETTLQGRDLDGNPLTFEAYYDTVLDITWLANTTAVGTTMNWVDANAWAAGLDVFGITGWRLPSVSPIDGTSFNIMESYNGTTDQGMAVTTSDGSDGGWRDGSGNPTSEMGHMYYVTLGNWGECDPISPTFCNPYHSPLNTGPFSIQGTNLWSASEFDASSAWLFAFSSGYQAILLNDYGAYAWAVRSGDVSAVPVPVALWLFGSGLLTLISVARHPRLT